MSTLTAALEALRSLPAADRVRLADALAADPPRSSPGDAPREAGMTAIVRVLRESERRLEDAQRMAHIGYWDRDLVTGLMTLSNEACSIFGFAPASQTMDLAQWHARWLSLIHPDDRPRITQVLSAAMRGDASYDVEYRVVQPGGAQRIIHSRAEITRDAEGKPLRMFGMMLDVSDLRRAEQARHDSETQFRAIVEHAADAFYLLDEHLSILDVNPQTCASLGYTRDELIGRSARDIDIATDDAAFRSLWEQLLRGQAVTFETVHRRKDGALLPVEVRSVAFEQAGRRYISLVRDISQRKRAEQEVKNLEAQLRQAQKLEAVGKLAGGIAHDFNNLLTVINSCTELAIELVGDTSAAELLHEVRHAGGRAGDLTRQLLAFSRRQMLQAEVIDVNATIQGVGTLLRRIIGEDVELEFSLDPTVGRVRVDRAQLEQAIVNLAVNARDAMPRGGHLRLETLTAAVDRTTLGAPPGLAPGDYAVIAVRDTGEGMGADTLERIFDPFFTTKPVGQGTGLGLSMVYGFLKQSGGDVAVDSVPRGGTTFRLYLPLTGDPPTAPRGAAEPRVEARGAETVLLAEDEASVRRLCVRVLTTSGYTVLEAADGEEALALASHTHDPIDLLITDIVMPRLGGRQLAERLSARQPQLRVLWLSGYSDVSPSHLELGPSMALLPKPFAPDALLRQVRALLDADAPTPGAQA